ncbi:S9 family peptidase [Mycetocola tolaasinivorans]|uniref:S9 family peptidase n=1 Tax=Mycetocola tolaasinivorans TaxID=76635 RepID=A0A3L7A336_9MICO|nr:S9 family peptidase [Mycetocola tolaasinivorans]RLP74736.1 S9 family peptidase [Mycetocola tolaasinivorans]
MASASAPRAEQRPTERTHHGDTVIDNYEWLRAKEDPEVLAHLEAENAFTEAHTAHLAPLRERIYNEIKDRTLETDLSVPTRQGAWWYYSRSVEGSQYALHCRAPLAGPDDWTPPTLDPEQPVPGEQVLLDGNILAEGNEFFSLGSFDVSTDGNTLLYSVDLSGDERYTLRFRDLSVPGEIRELPDAVENTFGGAFLSRDGARAYYTTVDDAWRPDTLWRHTIGANIPDEKIFHEGDERFWVGAFLTQSGKFLLIGVGSSVTSEWHLVRDEAAGSAPELIWPRRDGVEYDVEHAVLGGADHLLITHNSGAENFELVGFPLADLGTPAGSGPEHATVVLPHRPDVRLESVDVFASFLAVEYRREGLARVSVASLADTTSLTDIAPREIEFDEPLYTVHTGANPEWDQPTLRLGYGSLVTPSTVSELDVATGEIRVLKRQPVLGGYDPAHYEQAREWAVAADGTRIPISLVWKRGTNEAAGQRTPGPLELYGYGSYEASIDPTFSVARLSLLDRGVTFAIAHVRGGGELGRAWYENGKTLTKKNTFSDFVASARHLVSHGYTTPAQLVAEGGSAGGLLMGAVANLAPELFAGILASVPFVDPLTSILDPDLPLTVIEWDEWGNPLHDAEVYRYMKEYSPYENVRTDVTYPRILAVTSLNDTRVLYVEPAKWVARLREVEAPVLLKTEMVAGHGGVTGRYNSWRERAFELAWILDVLGLAEDGAGTDVDVDGAAH